MSKHQELPLELQSESGIRKWCSPFVCKWVLSSLFASHHTIPPPTPHFSPPLHLHLVRLGKDKTQHLSTALSQESPHIPPHKSWCIMSCPQVVPLNMQKPTLCDTDHTWAPRSTEGRDTSSPSHLPQASHMPRREKEKPLALCKMTLHLHSKWC